MNRRSFTLIELVVVIVVLAILAGAYVMISRPDDSVKLSIAGKKIAADIEYARTRSLTMAKWHGVQFLSPTQYRVYSTDGLNDVDIEDPSALGKNYTVNLSELFSGVSVLSSSFGTGNKVEFSPLGAPYADKNDTVPLSSSGTVTLQCGSGTYTITVAQNTGMVLVP